MKNRGFFYSRVKHGPREKAFADAWEKENRPDPSKNSGFGILQDLLVALNHPHHPPKHHKVTNDERKVAATAIQWLGSNCGWCWLEDVLDECGYMLVRKKRMRSRS